MTAIGFICEDLQPKDLNEELKDKIIQTLVTSVFLENDKIDITRLAIKALYFSIPYATKCFSIENDRDFIMQKIIGACSLPDEEIQDKALQCLRDIAS